MSSPEESSEILITALQGAETDEDRAEIWHAYLAGTSDTHNETVDDTRETLHKGTPADAIEISNRNIGSRALGAANEISDSGKRYKI